MIKNVVIILAAGIGSRYGSEKPKQFTELNGRQVISYSISAVKKSVKTDRFLVVIEDDIRLKEEMESIYGVNCIFGGRTRAESFNSALNAVQVLFGGCENIIFHEAGRPLIRAEDFDKYFELLEDFDYVETCREITDSLGRYDRVIPVREQYYLIEAPEAYKYNLLVNYFDVKSDIYYAAFQLPLDAKGYLNFDMHPNYKLTRPGDKKLLEYYLKNEDAEM